jgi:hypothetical protein
MQWLQDIMNGKGSDIHLPENKGPSCSECFYKYDDENPSHCGLHREKPEKCMRFSRKS